MCDDSDLEFGAGVIYIPSSAELPVSRAALEPLHHYNPAGLKATMICEDYVTRRIRNICNMKPGSAAV